jgi:hypothetical protein
VLELVSEALAELDGLRRDSLGGGEVGEEEEHGETVVEVTEGVDKGRVALFDDVVEGHLGGEVLLHAVCVGDFIATESTTNLLGQSLVVAELVEKGLMEQVLDVASVVEGGGLGRV